jgi:hypothetical protein
MILAIGYVSLAHLRRDAAAVALLTPTGATTVTAIKHVPFTIATVNVLETVSGAPPASDAWTAPDRRRRSFRPGLPSSRLAQRRLDRLCCAFRFPTRWTDRRAVRRRRWRPGPFPARWTSAAGRRVSGVVYGRASNGEQLAPGADVDLTSKTELDDPSACATGSWASSYRRRTFDRPSLSATPSVARGVATLRRLPRVAECRPVSNLRC